MHIHLYLLYPILIIKQPLFKSTWYHSCARPDILGEKRSHLYLNPTLNYTYINPTLNYTYILILITLILIIKINPQWFSNRYNSWE